MSTHQERLEANKAFVLAWLREHIGGDFQTALAMLHEDLEFWVLPSTVSSGSHDKASFIALVEKTKEKALGPFTMEIYDVLAEGDLVNVTAKGHCPLKSGRVFETDYSFLFTMKDGKIARIKEYIDTAHYNDVLFAPVAA